MKSFETFNYNNRSYRISRKETGEVYIGSIHPYDNSEYHWAMSSNGTDWTIYIKNPGRYVASISTPSYEEVAKVLEKHDTGITPQICHY